MIQYCKNLLWGFVLLFSLNNCKEVEPADPNEQKLANKDWNTDGVYINTDATAEKVISPNIKIRFKNTATSKTLAINSIDLNIIATWSISANGTQITLSYPTVSGTSLSFSSQTLKIAKLSDTELWLAPLDGSGEIKLFGVITLTNTMQYRFTTGTGSGANLTNATLTNVTWDGNKNTDAGLFIDNGGGYVRQSGVNLKLKFNNGFAVAGQTFFGGTNIVLVGGIPTSIWGIDNATAPTKLTLAIPTGGTYVSFNITKLDNDELWLTYTGANQVSIFGVININANNQLRFVPE